MKKLLPLFILIFAFGVSAQVKKPVPQPNDTKTVLLKQLQKQKQDAEDKRRKLLVQFTEDYPQVKQASAEIASIDAQIRKLIAGGARVEFDDLPDDSTFLLKLLIIQNQRIIELLEQRK